MVNIWRIVYWIYPLTFITSIPLTLLFKRHHVQISQLFFVRFLEKFIVRKVGYVWFTLIFWIQILPYYTTKTLDRKVVINFTRIYAANTIVIILLLDWFFGSPIFERISVASGAYCTNESFNREYPCEAAGGEWINPFDSSSHYTFLISSSLLVWYLLVKYLAFPHRLWTETLPPVIEIDLENTYPRISHSSTGENAIIDSPLRLGIIGIVLMFIFFWYCLFLITSIFFHTIPEKIVGLFCGMFVPTIIPFIESI